MKDLEKMVLMLFLGIVICIVVLGFHRSGSSSSTASGGNPTSTQPVMQTGEIAGLV